MQIHVLERPNKYTKYRDLYSRWCVLSEASKHKNRHMHTVVSFTGMQFSLSLSLFLSPPLRPRHERDGDRDWDVTVTVIGT
jgi:hypothetical protein